MFNRCESIAYDIASHFVNNRPTLGKFADEGLNSFAFYCNLVPNSNDQFIEYFLATAFYMKKSDGLITNTLRSLYTAPQGWHGNEILNAGVMVINSLASIPDIYQNDRISLIMQCRQNVNNDEHPIGLLRAPNAFHSMRQRPSESYSHTLIDAYERYIDILKQMTHIRSVVKWMEENRSAWASLERDICEPPQHTGHGQSRSDYSGRRDSNDVGVDMDHNQQSDSDVIPGMHESEEDDDEDSRFDDVPEPCEFFNVKVSNAGNTDVNGLYERDGQCEGVTKYSRYGQFKGNTCKFSLFKCNVSNNTQHWYISVVPGGREPGTVQDTDFYSASVTAEYESTPPPTGWNKCNEGIHPPPTLTLLREDPVVIQSFDRSVGDQNGGQPFV